jgi:hypothetical protein
MDTDIVVFADFVPHVVGTGADMAAMVEKCRVVDERKSYTGMDVRDVPFVSARGHAIRGGTAL